METTDEEMYECMVCGELDNLDDCSCGDCVCAKCFKVCDICQEYMCEPCAKSFKCLKCKSKIMCGYCFNDDNCPCFK